VSSITRQHFTSLLSSLPDHLICLISHQPVHAAAHLPTPRPTVPLTDLCPHTHTPDRVQEICELLISSSFLFSSLLSVPISICLGVNIDHLIRMRLQEFGEMINHPFHLMRRGGVQLIAFIDSDCDRVCELRRVR
jgi:hypothetical protein